MPEAASEFRLALEKISQGSKEAVWEFIETYGPHIQRVVRRRLHQSLRTKFDSVDFVQMVWASLFADLHKIAHLRDPDELIRYLVGIAHHKVVDETRRRTKYERYNVMREQPLTDSDLCEPKSIRKSDTPSQLLIAKERLQQMMNGTSRRDRKIVEMRLKGATYVEIGKAMGLHERTVRQIVGDLEHATVH